MTKSTKKPQPIGRPRNVQKNVRATFTLGGEALAKIKQRADAIEKAAGFKPTVSQALHAIIMESRV